VEELATLNELNLGETKMAGIPQTFGVGKPIALTDGATITLDLSAQAQQGSAFSVTLAGSRTLNVTNMVPGQLIRGIVTQDGTGSRVLTVNVNGVAALVSGTPLTTTAAAVDMVEIAFDGDTGYYYPIAKAFS
jgi:hypothetical protein